MVRPLYWILPDKCATSMVTGIDALIHAGMLVGIAIFGIICQLILAKIFGLRIQRKPLKPKSVSDF
jgi:hypothetical protein